MEKEATSNFTAGVSGFTKALVGVSAAIYLNLNDRGALKGRQLALIVCFYKHAGVHIYALTLGNFQATEHLINL